jgi:hypothetical protein
MKGMAAAPLPMITVIDPAGNYKTSAAAPLRRPSIARENSDLQDFAARSGFEFACIYGHREHAVIPDGAGQLDKSLIAEPLSK